MLMSVIASGASVGVYSELAGARVLVTGLSSRIGIDVARAFAEYGCRLVLQAPGDDPELVGMAEVLAKSALDVRMFHDAVTDSDAAVRFAQAAVQAYGGLDAAVNLIAVDPAQHQGCVSVSDIEALVSRKLLPATLMTRVLANRMRLTLTEGMILNVVLMPEPRTVRERALADLFRATLAAATRGEAAQWAGEGIRINAIGPRPADPSEGAGASVASEPDIAALALVLASKRGRGQAGHVFDADGFASVRC